MATKFEDLRLLLPAEEIADGIWNSVMCWNSFAREVVGGQMARAADSIGANIAEAFGRFHYGEKLQFLYYARGSIFETKYWLNRALARALMSESEAEGYAAQLTTIARQLNAFAGSLKRQRSGERKPPATLRETRGEYVTDTPTDFPNALFTESDLIELQSLSVGPLYPNDGSPISNLQPKTPLIHPD